jgi:hypothetical protein
MQQQSTMREEWKRNFNLGYSFLLMHQRALVVPVRRGWGREALGMPCLCAFVLMCMWAAFSRDIHMWWWIGAWLVFQSVRRLESVKLARSGARIHSQYDGTSAIRGDERKAKLIGEPMMFGLAGFCFYLMYLDKGWPVQGLPYFFMAGIFSLPFIEGVKATIWQRRTQAMSDARIEQEQAVTDYRNTYGDE